MSRGHFGLSSSRPRSQGRKYIAIVLGISISSWAKPVSAVTADTTTWTLQEIGDVVAGHSGTTYLELLQQVMPDLDDKGGGRLSKPLRHIASGYGGEPPMSLDIGSLRVLAFMAEGRRHIAVLTGIGSVEATVEQPVLLAVFDDEHNPKLLDAVDIGMDRDTSYGTPALVDIGRENEALVTRSSHFNSSEGFATTALIMLQRSKLTLIDTFSTYGVRVCGASTQQVLGLEGRPTQAKEFDILVVIEERAEPTGETCDGESPDAAPVTRAETVYRWDGKAMNFRAMSDALEKLQLRTAEQIGGP
ncbi:MULTISPECIES: hypothetical protein [unclassified Rhizobium]|uniref:hypothetical protein n=1 Tax=unclassified Rhizobium TaxID=2613769 RepID=UPI00078974F3|nr:MULTISPECIES: hypothetical protein [unclassified Rhizobium]